MGRQRRHQSLEVSESAGIDPHLREWTKKYGYPDGKTYFIPGGYNAMVPYCNTEVFAKAGVTLPDSDWTWDEFKAAGTQIKQRTGAYLTAIGDGTFPFGDIMPWLLTNGASTLNADWTADVNSPAAVEAATFVKGLLDAGLAPKLSGSTNSYDAPGQLAQGKLASLVGGRWPTVDMRRLKLVEKVRILNWPTKADKGSPIGWDGRPILRAPKGSQLLPTASATALPSRRPSRAQRHRRSSAPGGRTPSPGSSRCPLPLNEANEALRPLL